MILYPSRILNEKPGFLGLQVTDLIILGYMLILSHSILSVIDLELLSFVITGLVAFLLISIRMSHRPKTVRDYLVYKLTKNIFRKNRGLYDSGLR